MSLSLNVRETVKRGLYGLSYHLHAPKLSDLVRGRRVMILIYHGIPKRDHFEGVANYYGYSIPLKEFEQHLLYLKRRCHVISLDSLISGNGLSRTKTNIVLTFDDGYENHYLNAFELLQHYNLPAVFALPTAFVLKHEPLWDDIIEYAVNRCTKKQVHIKWEGEEHHFSLQNLSERLVLYNWLLRQSVQVEQSERDVLIAKALQALAISADSTGIFQNEDYRPLTQAQIREMLKSGLATFASHSVNHYLLAKCDREMIRTELTDSKRDVENLTGIPCATLCLPGGSYDEEVLEQSFEAGYEYVLTSDTGPVANGKRVLNRNGVFREHDAYRFADLVHGPVSEILQATHRVRGAVRAILN